MSISPPTIFLPAISTLRHSSPSSLVSNISVLRKIYTPDVRGSGLTQRKEEASEDLQFDHFERSYSTRWLTALIALSEEWEMDGKLLHKAHERDCYCQALNDAAALLALCSGSAAAPSFCRSLSFSTCFQKGGDEFFFEVDIQDAPLESQDFSSVGNQTWGSSCVLAQLLTSDPGLFRLDGTYPHLRILELGAGTGLVSVVIAKILSHLPKVQGEVVSTDFHPSVLRNLQVNVAKNAGGSNNFPVRVAPLDWSHFQNSSLPHLIEPFDLVFGADIVYEMEHARWIKSCVECLLRKPSVQEYHSRSPFSLPFPMFYLILPLRSTHRKESMTIEDVFPTITSPPSGAETSLENKKWTLGIVMSQQMNREDQHSPQSPESSVEVIYQCYCIGWGQSQE